MADARGTRAADPLERLLALCHEFARHGPHGRPLSTPEFAIDTHDLEQLFIGLDQALVSFAGTRGKFNTIDRPRSGGHWSLLSFYQDRTIINGEYLPQLGGYVDLITRLGFHPHRVLFEPGDRCLRIDHAVLDDNRRIVIVGESKVDPNQPNDLVRRIRTAYADREPAAADRPPGKGPQYEAWKLAVALWKIRSPFLWLTAPGQRLPFRVTYGPMTLEPLADLPDASDLDLLAEPSAMLTSIDYR